MRLVDTSIWVDFLRGEPAAAELARLLEERAVLSHPWVLGELALGNLGARRSAILRDLASLPLVPAVEHAEVLEFVERHGLAGSGLGWVDVHLIASSRLARADLWTRDKAVARALQRLGGVR